MVWSGACGALPVPAPQLSPALLPVLSSYSTPVVSAHFPSRFPISLGEDAQSEDIVCSTSAPRLQICWKLLCPVCVPLTSSLELAGLPIFLDNPKVTQPKLMLLCKELIFLLK